MSGFTETPVPARLCCAQCGCPLPDDASEIARWRHGRLAAAGELDETSAGMLLCPECMDDAVHGGYELGAVD